MADTTSTTESSTQSPSQSVPCTKGDVYGCSCPVCSPPVPPKARVESTNPRNIALKEMRKSTPRASITKDRVIEAVSSELKYRPGTKAEKCKSNYSAGLTVAEVIELAPEGLKSYAYDCVVWDVQHGLLTLK